MEKEFIREIERDFDEVIELLADISAKLNYILYLEMKESDSNESEESP